MQTSPAGGRVEIRAILAAPEADTLAVLRRSARVEVIGRSEGWARVRLEGWLPDEDLDLTELTGPGLTLSDIRADPDGAVGSIVRWGVQQVSLQRVDSLRSDMPLGEPYLLLRDPGGEAGFVYALVPPDLLSAASNMAPLQRFEIRARVRTGRSPLTGHPIVELLEILP